MQSMTEPRFHVQLNSDLVTSARKPSSRIKTDDQPTSYEENRQFKIFRRFIDVPTTDQIVFKFTANVPCNIMERKINLWSGGREYLVIPDDGSYSAVDAQLTAMSPTAVNGNLDDTGLTVHPVSGIEILYGTGAGLFTIDSSYGTEDQFPNGDAVQTVGNANRANSVLLSTPNMSGVASGQAFYLVFRNISQASVTSGHFYLQWEETQYYTP